jgi:hypothetical protein
MARYEGYYDNHDLPIRRGQFVTIRKGVTVKVLRLVDGAYRLVPKTAGRTYKVKVHHVINGGRTYYSGEPVLVNPSVCWAGSGGLWHEVDINDVPEIDSSFSGR